MARITFKDFVDSKKSEILDKYKGRWVSLFGISQDSISLKISQKKPKIINNRKMVWDLDDSFEYASYELGTDSIWTSNLSDMIVYIGD